MTSAMRSPRSLLPLALGHDQEASACPWVRLTAPHGRLSIAHRAGGAGCRQAAQCRSRPTSSTSSTAATTAAAAAPLRSCRVRRICRARSGRCALRSWRRGRCPRWRRWPKRSRDHGNIYGDLRPASTGSVRASRSATSSSCRARRRCSTTRMRRVAALRAVRSVMAAPSTCGSTAIDSGQTLRELGLAEEAAKIRERLARSSSAMQDTEWWLPERRKRRSVCAKRWLVCRSRSVRRQRGRPRGARTADRRCSAVDSRAVVFHPSETLLHRIDGFAGIDRWLRAWLGDRYVPEPDPALDAWPAAIERPAMRNAGTA